MDADANPQRSTRSLGKQALAAPLPVNKALSEAIGTWLRQLQQVRGYSIHTTKAYRADISTLLASLADYEAKVLTLEDLEQLEPRALRAFL